MRIVVAAVAAAAMGAGCMGGNIFGANPGDGGCGFAPDGLVADDLTGTWEGNQTRFTLQAGGVASDVSFLQPSSSPSSSGRPSGAPSKRPSASVKPSARPNASPSTAAAAVRWSLTIERDRADLYITVAERADRGYLFMVSGTREEPWLYTFGDGDPDSCNITKYQRTAR